MTSPPNAGDGGDFSTSGYDWTRAGPGAPPNPGSDWQGIGPFGIGPFGGDPIGIASHFWSNPPPGNGIGPFGGDPVGTASYFWSNPPPGIGPFGAPADGWVV